jgi:CRISP-associated protein Cas1
MTSSSATSWEERGRYWDASAFGFSRDAPLILTGHGAHISVHQGTLLIKDGFTRYPQDQAVHRLFPGTPGLPSAVILVDGDGEVSIDALQWLSGQSVPLIVLDWRGRVTVATADVPADPELWLGQARAAQARPFFPLAIRLLAEKFLASLRTLDSLPSAGVVTRAAEAQWEALDALDTAEDVRGLFLIEARAANAYFAAPQGLQLSWKGLGRKPIPDAWHRVPGRATWGAGNRHASHPFNALLNYGYGVLEGRVTAALRQSGLHPSMGVLHGRSKERPSLTFDLMEPFRAVVDRVVLDLIRTRTLSRDDVELTSAGVCRVRPELARVVVRAVGAAVDAAPMVAIARDAFVSGRCETQVWRFASSRAEGLRTTVIRHHAVSQVDYSRPRRRSATAPAAQPRGPISAGPLADRPPMSEHFRSTFVRLLDERGMSRTRLAALCDLQIAYWQRALGNTRLAPAREALERAAPHLGIEAESLAALAGYTTSRAGSASLLQSRPPVRND